MSHEDHAARRAVAAELRKTTINVDDKTVEFTVAEAEAFSAAARTRTA